MCPEPRTPPLPALAEGIIVIQPPQLPLLQLLLQLQLQPRTLPVPHVPPTQLLLALAGGTIVILQQTPLHLALVEGIIVVLLLDQKVGFLKMHQGAVLISKANLDLEGRRNKCNTDTGKCQICVVHKDCHQDATNRCVLPGHESCFYCEGIGNDNIDNKCEKGKQEHLPLF